MGRWITFDAKTASELRSRLTHESIFEAPGRNALEYALTASGTVVAVLPSGMRNYCALATFRPRLTRAAVSSSPRMVIRASGFFGLSDAPVLEEEEASRRSWWQKFWED